MSNLSSILTTDLISTGPSVLNGNFGTLNRDKVEISSIMANAIILGSSVVGVITPLASLGTVGQVLTSNGSGAAPNFQSLTVTSFPNSSVFNAECPSIFSNLNLSSTVGTASRVVILKALNNTPATSNILTFRKLGDIDTFTGAASNDGINIAQIAAGRAVYVIALTNSSGVVEWGGVNVASVILTVEAYW